MPRDRKQADARALARLTARLLREGKEALYRDPALYDQLYRRRTRDVEFYQRLAAPVRGPVLELGVGSGRVAVALARAGREVVGVDSMPSMLRAARERIARLPRAIGARISLQRGDLRDLELDRRFALVIAPFNTFMHLYTRSDLERALASCRSVLLPSGQLAFDVMNPDLRALTQAPDRLFAAGRLRHPITGTRYRVREASHYDPVAQIRNITMVLEPLTAGQPSLAVPLAHRQFFPEELLACLEHNGFSAVRRFGGFAGEPFDERSETQILVARPRRPR